ncbi:hypothetical protein [Flavisolibacter ginsengisoli]|uniref:Uncharacterized protein n=1 Tax=Flavisolibacter ginsengisoli DSM 18119 TaxID=1121884 RepID=A0A1M5FWZ0_9BACT|nr:hypothetical protein [Flavisolibacter ginsengisoli]SHF96080.1 hypothetical protein SAMN02745131_03977 [Flavisolibacter ginsengisoli DSM 18119]
MPENQSKGSELENNSTRSTENKNETLNDPGAPVVDYGRASQGNMESQQEQRSSGQGMERDSKNKNNNIGSSGNSL